MKCLRLQHDSLLLKNITFSFFSVFKIALLGAILYITPLSVKAVNLVELYPTITSDGYVSECNHSGQVVGYRTFNGEYSPGVSLYTHFQNAKVNVSWDTLCGEMFTMEGGFANGASVTSDGQYWVAVTSEGDVFTADYTGTVYYWRAVRMNGVWSPILTTSEISSSTRTFTLADNFKEQELGSEIVFEVSTPQRGVVYTSESIQATTTGSFHYTWVYPDFLEYRTTQEDIYVFTAKIKKDAEVIRYSSREVSLAAPVEGYPGYGNFSSDGSDQIQSSYNNFVQTLGTNLSGTLTQIDIKTSSPGALYYGSQPRINIFECNHNTYSLIPLDIGECTEVFEGISHQASKLDASIQSIYLDTPIVFDSTKYYIIYTRGSNQFNTLTRYYGSADDVVDGECQQTNGLVAYPCDGIKDLYFYLRGISKAVIPEEKGLSNVLFLPGLQASRLYENRGVTCQFNCEDQLWESNKKTDVEHLYLNEDGTSIRSGIYTRDAISETNTPISFGFAGQNIYKSFFATLDSLTESTLPREERMNDWEVYAYDWRYNVKDIVEQGAQYEDGTKSLIGTLQRLADSSSNGKVTIIAHSNGGLLAKALFIKLEEMKAQGLNNLIDSVDVLMLVASPQIGTATAVPVMLHGYDQKILLGALLDPEHARELGRNMPGAYGLLPSREYINRIDIAPVIFADNQIPSGVTTGFTDAYGPTIDSYTEYKDFLLGNEGRINPSISNTKLPITLSPTLFSQAESLHNTLDAWIPPESIRVIQVAGWGLDTVASFEYRPKLTGCTGGSVGCTNPYTLDQRPIFTVDGDKTVVEPSALYMVGEKYWVDFQNYNSLGKVNREHKDIFEVDQLNNLIKSVISKTDIVFDTVLKDTKPIDTKNRLRISIHSPVALGGYDTKGNFTGKVCVDTEDFCYIQEDIPNSSYMEFGEGKYLNLPEENVQKIVLQGTGTGTFTFESDRVLASGETVRLLFADIPVTPQTLGEVVINQSTMLPELKLDVTGDGVFDLIISSQKEHSLVLPEETIQKVALQSSGTGIVESVRVLPGEDFSQSIFAGTPVKPQTSGEVVVKKKTSPPKIARSMTNTRTLDLISLPQKDFNHPGVSLWTMEKTSKSLEVQPARKTILSRLIDGIIKALEKRKVSRVKFRVEKLQEVSVGKIRKPAPKTQNPQRLSNADTEVLIGMLGKLLNNLEK